MVDNRLISSKSLVACIVPTTRTSLPKRMHVWELFNEYYGMKVSKNEWSVVSRLTTIVVIAVGDKYLKTNKYLIIYEGIHVTELRRNG